jgi:hypothetical protein
MKPFNGSFKDYYRLSSMALKHHNWVPLVNDFLFKKLMTECPESLLGFVNTVLCPEIPFTSIEFLDKEIPKSHPKDRGLFLDLLLKVGDKALVNLEVQCVFDHSLSQRAQYHLIRVGGSSLQVNQAFMEAPKIIVLFITMISNPNSSFLELPYCRYEFMRSLPIQPYPPVLPNGVSLIDFLDLNLLLNWSEFSDKHLRELQEWGKFLLPNSLEEWEALQQSNPKFHQMGDKVKQYHRDGEILTAAQLRQHEIEFELYERKAKFELGRAEGRAEGEAKGRVEGEAKGKWDASVEMARALLERGMNLTEIASITKLSEDQIKALLN